MKNRLKSFGLGLAIFFVVLMYAGAVSLFSDTLVSVVPVVSVSILVALLSFWPARELWPRLSGCASVWINTLLHTVAVAGFVMFVFLFGNYAGADRNTDHTERAEVVRKYTKTRHRTRRINRRTTSQGAPYKVYFAELRFSDGRVKNLEMTIGQYNRIRSGNMVEMTVARGLFGVPVIRRDMPVSDTGFSVPQSRP